MRSPYGVRRPKDAPPRPPRRPGKDLEHIAETGLPPGIDEDVAKDPGSVYHDIPKDKPRGNRESG